MTKRTAYFLLVCFWTLALDLDIIMPMLRERTYTGLDVACVLISFTMLTHYALRFVRS